MPDYNESIEGDDLKSDRPDMAAYQEYFMTVDPNLKRVPTERLKKAFQQTKLLRLEKKLKSADADEILWTGYSTEYGGRTRALMFDPNDPENKKVWAGAVTGGLWYNNDITSQASSWVPVGDFWDNLSISCIASDPNNSLTFYVGSGEAPTAVIIYRESSGRGSGIWKTTDGGQTWNVIPSTENFAYITDISLRSESGNTVIYAGVVSGKYKGSDHQSLPGDGLYRSEDGGNSWTQVLPNIEGLSVPYAPSDIEIGADGRIFVGTGRNLDGEGAATILYSDTGTSGSWVVFNDYKTIIESEEMYHYPGRVMLASAPSDANIVYALVSSGYIRYDSFIGYYCLHILRSDNKGVTWKQLDIPYVGENRTWATLAWHALTGAVDPNDPNTVWIGGLDLFRTTNADADTVDWLWASSWWNKGSSYDPENLPYVHADQHLIVYRSGNSDEIVFTTDGGVFYSDNATAEEPAFTEMNNNYTTLQFYTGAIHPTRNMIYYLGGLQDNGTLLRHGGTAPNNIFVSGGDGSYCFIDEDQPGYQITSVYRNLYNFIANFQEWNSIRYEEFYGTGTFINPAEYDFRLNTLFANSMTFTGQFEDTLLVINNIPYEPSGYFIPLNSGSRVPYSAILASRYSPEESSTIYVGTQSGRLFRVEEAQYSPKVEEITGQAFPSGNISCIAMGGSEDTLLITYSNYGISSVWRTTDGGKSWENKEGNLPDMPIRGCILLPQDSRNALLATEIGVWSTQDLDSEPVIWEPAVEGMANVRVDMIRLRRSDNTVLAATHGRGFYTTSYNADMVKGNVSIEEINIYPNPSIGEFKITFSCSYHQDISIRVFSVNGNLIESYKIYSYIGPFSKSFDFRNYGNGIYLIELVIANKSYQKKVVIQH